MKNKVVVITGASQGLGKELSLGLAKPGNKMALVARGEERLKQIKDKINKNGGTAEYFVCDVTKVNQIKETIKKIINKFGKIDVLINGAGVFSLDELENEKPELTEEVLKVNSVGTINFIRLVLPYMEKADSGHIVNVISRAGLELEENKDWMTYTASKWAVTGYTKALQAKLTKTAIKVSGIYPGAFESNIFEKVGYKEAHNQDWMMKTSQVAGAIVWVLNQPDKIEVSSLSLYKKDENK